MLEVLPDVVFSSEITTRIPGNPSWQEAVAQRRKCFESAVNSKPVGNNAANSLPIDVVGKSTTKSFSLVATLRPPKDHSLGKSVSQESWSHGQIGQSTCREVSTLPSRYTNSLGSLVRPRASGAPGRSDPRQINSQPDQRANDQLAAQGSVHRRIGLAE